MQSPSVVLLQGNSSISEYLIASFRNSFPSVHEARSTDDLRTGVARYRAAVAIVDLEIAAISEVERLSHDFPAICIVCTHRLPDEAMWLAALSAGAVDICPSDDVRGVVASAQRSVSQRRSAAA